MKSQTKILGLFLLLCLSCATLVQAEQHYCPTAADLRHRLYNKSLMNYDCKNWGAMGGINYCYGSIEVTDSFNTNEKWVFEFTVRHVSSLDEAWNLFTNYFDSLTNENRVAEYHGSFWKCRYGIGPEDFDNNKEHTYDLEIRLKSR